MLNSDDGSFLYVWQINFFMFRVFRSDWYDKKLKKLDKSDQNVIENFEKQLKIEPYAGRPLGYKFLREKKFGGKRLIFLVYEEHRTAFLVTITNKKAQQHEIDMIKASLDVYKEIVNELLKKL